MIAFIKKSRITIIFTLLTLAIMYIAGCNPILNSQRIRPINIDTYTLSKKGSDSLKLHKEITQQAHTFCAEKKLHFMPADRNYSETFYALTFRCLNAGDPELHETDSFLPSANFHKKIGGFGELKY